MHRKASPKGMQFLGLEIVLTCVLVQSLFRFYTASFGIYLRSRCFHLRWEKSIGGYFLLFLIFFWGVSLEASLLAYIYYRSLFLHFSLRSVQE